MGVACYAGLVLFAQGAKFWVVLRAFPFSYLPLLLALAFLNYMLRYFRWEIYLRALGIRLGSWRSFQIFMAGLAMTVTPGKAGEALKAFLLKQEADSPWSMGLPVVFTERLTDLMGVVILTALGLKLLPGGKGVVLVGVVVCVFLLLMFSNSTLFRGMVRFLGKFPGMVGRARSLLEIHQHVTRLMSPRLMLLTVVISCIAWFAECLVLYFAIIAFQFKASLLQATFIYAFSTLAGAFSILPGGLVATEGSMAGLLLLFGLERSTGSVVTLIVRICTLWFAVFLGAVFLFCLQRMLRFSRQEVLREKILSQARQ